MFGYYRNTYYGDKEIGPAILFNTRINTYEYYVIRISEVLDR